MDVLGSGLPNLQPLLTWFTSFGVAVPLPSGAPGGIATGWLANFQADVAQFVTNFVVQRLVPTLAAFFMLRAVLDAASGQHPLPVHFGCDVLVGNADHVQPVAELQHRNAVRHGRCAGHLWNHLAGTIMPIAAVLALVGAILNFATKKPFLRLVAISLAL